MLITGLTPGDLDGLSHLAMTGEIAAKLAAWSPATIVAYNGLTFDEEHLRHALFATLHPPYLTQRPGNGRTDILVMARAIAALRRSADGAAYRRQAELQARPALPGQWHRPP